MTLLMFKVIISRLKKAYELFITDKKGLFRILVFQIPAVAVIAATV